MLTSVNGKCIVGNKVFSAIFALCKGGDEAFALFGQDRKEAKAGLLQPTLIESSNTD
jgi:hypothetical protein